MTARITDGALAFQADLDRLVAEPAPLGLRLWPVLGAGLVAALLIVASVVRIDIVVVATGRLAADAPSVILQPMTRAVLKELLVKPGDRVHAGQVLARLDSTLTDADRAALDVERRALSAKVARLQAELSGDAMASGGADLAMEAAVMTQRADLAAAQRNQLAAAIQSLHQQIAAETGADAGLTERQEIAREIEGMRAALAQRQSGSHLAALEARLVRIEAETAFDQHFARLDDLRQRLAQAEAALRAFESDRKRLLTEALAEVVPRLAEVEEQLTKADRLAALADLRAPLPGVVLSVAKGGPGSLMAESDPIVVLVPTDVPLIAEVGIKSSEAGTIAMGDPVTIKVDAFPWRRNGSLTGVLQDVSHGSFTPEGGTQALHSGRVTLSGGLSYLAPGAGLLPGMTVSAEIKTGTRTILDYFLDPLMRGMTESLREP
jgi:HlyD family secretion protein